MTAPKKNQAQEALAAAIRAGIYRQLEREGLLSPEQLERLLRRP